MKATKRLFTEEIDGYKLVVNNLINKSGNSILSQILESFLNRAYNAE